MMHILCECFIGIGQAFVIFVARSHLFLAYCFETFKKETL